MSETDVRFLRSQTERLVVQSKSKMKSNAALGPANRRSVRSARSGLSFAHPSLTCFDPLPPLSLQEAVIQRLNPPNPCGFICTVGWSVGLDIALTFLDLQKAIAHIVR